MSWITLIGLIVSTVHFSMVRFIATAGCMIRFITIHTTMEDTTELDIMEVVTMEDIMEVVTMEDIIILGDQVGTAPITQLDTTGTALITVGGTLLIMVDIIIIGDMDTIIIEMT